MSGSRFSRFHRTIFRLLSILLVFVTYFHGLPDGLASSPRQKPRYQENEPTDGPEATPPPVAAPARIPVAPVKLILEKPVAAAALSVDNREERILDFAFKKLKGQDVQGALRALNQLTKEFPDNPDYALLYRMALKRQEAQQWYRYQDWVEQRHSNAKPFVAMTEPLKKESNQPGRINELKRATWVILATGKHPSPDPARKVIVEPDSEDLEAK